MGPPNGGGPTPFQPKPAFSLSGEPHLAGCEWWLGVGTRCSAPSVSHRLATAFALAGLIRVAAANACAPHVVPALVTSLFLGPSVSLQAVRLAADQPPRRSD